MGVIVGAKLATFTILLAYVYLLDRSTNLSARPLMLLASAFILMVLGEVVYIFEQGQSTPLGWFTSFQNLQLYVDVLELGVVAGAILFLRSFRSQLES
jgi:hypothetical protein